METIIDKINKKIEEYLEKILVKDEISKEEFDLLVGYRNTEESREAMKMSMAALTTSMHMPALTTSMHMPALTTSMHMPADVKYQPLAAYDEKEVN